MTSYSIPFTQVVTGHLTVEAGTLAEAVSKAEVLLKIAGTEGAVSVGHLEIPVNVTTDEKRPGQLNVRADTSGLADTLRRIYKEN